MVAALVVAVAVVPVVVIPMRVVPLPDGSPPGEPSHLWPRCDGCCSDGCLLFLTSQGPDHHRPGHCMKFVA